jgi:hypothetical protein
VVFVFLPLPTPLRMYEWDGSVKFPLTYESEMLRAMTWFEGRGSLFPEEPYPNLKGYRNYHRNGLKVSEKGLIFYIAWTTSFES